MTLRILFVHLALALAVTAGAAANPVDQLRELDRQLKDGEISKAEHDRRWKAVIEEGLRPARVTPAKRPPPPRLPNEFSIAATWSALDADTYETADQLGAILMLGHFVTPHLQLAVGAQYGQADFDDVDFDARSVLGVADYHFMPTAPLVPYVGVGAAWVRTNIGSRDHEDWYWVAHVGLKQYVTPVVAIRYQAEYHQYGDLDLQGAGASVGVCFAF